jgi:hypothetical protein
MTQIEFKNSNDLKRKLYEAYCNSDFEWGFLKDYSGKIIVENTDGLFIVYYDSELNLGNISYSTAFIAKLIFEGNLLKIKLNLKPYFYYMAIIVFISLTILLFIKIEFFYLMSIYCTVSLFFLFFKLNKGKKVFLNNTIQFLIDLDNVN